MFDLLIFVSSFVCMWDKIKWHASLWILLSWMLTILWYLWWQYKFKYTKFYKILIESVNKGRDINKKIKKFKRRRIRILILSIPSHAIHEISQSVRLLYLLLLIQITNSLAFINVSCQILWFYVFFLWILANGGAVQDFDCPISLFGGKHQL